MRNPAGSTAGGGTAEAGGRGPQILVRARHTEVTERFRAHVAGKLAGLDRLDHKLYRLDVEVTEEHNPRMSAACERLEITAYSRGPVVRAEAAAADAYAALDLAYAKLEERLRRAADRRHSRGSRVAKAHQVEASVPTGGLPWPGEPSTNGTGPAASASPEPAFPGRGAGAAPEAADPAGGAAEPADRAEPVVEGDEDGPFLVREKVHEAAPMSLDDALAAMELVGHDFYLFTDADRGCPSVVYRRRGYHYGVLRLRDTISGDPGGNMPAEAAG